MCIHVKPILFHFTQLLLVFGVLVLQIATQGTQVSEKQSTWEYIIIIENREYF